MKVYAKYVYTLAGDVFAPGFVEYDPTDGRILAAGMAQDVPEGELDGAIVPGFVNSHCHVELSYMKGLFRRGTGMAGFIDQINELRDVAPLQERLADIQTQMDGMWRSGVSAMADISNCDDSFAIKAASPLYTRTFLEVFGTEPQDCDAVMDGVRKLQRKAAECGLDAAPTPHSCYTMSPQLVEASSAAGLESGYLSFHSEETPEEEEMIGSGSGKLWDNRKAAGIIGINKETVNNYVRKALADELGIDGLLRLDDPVLEHRLKGGSPAYPDRRFGVFKELLPYLEEEMKRKHVTLKLLWEEYVEEHPDDHYSLTQFRFHCGTEGMRSSRHLRNSRLIDLNHIP